MTPATLCMENLINNWNADFPDYQLTVEDLKKPVWLMGALFQVFDRLGIDRDAVLTPPPEKNGVNEHCTLYWDLIPIINMTRVINHLLSIMPQPVVNVSIHYFLQPMARTTYSMLLLPFNLMVFNEQQLRGIAQYEEVLFLGADRVKEMEDRKNQVFEMLNRQAEEKGKRAERMELLEAEIRVMEEVMAEEQACDQESQDLDTIIQENNITDVLLDQKRATKEGLLAERERKRALRVYDADEVRAKVVQAAQSVQEAEEKVATLQARSAQKEDVLRILQVIKPNLDAANNLLEEISKLKDSEPDDVDADSKEDELDLHTRQLSELEAQAGELGSAREELHRRRQEALATRHHEKTMAESAVKEEEEKDRKRREFISQAELRAQDIRLQTSQYEQQKSRGYQTIKEIADDYHNAIKAWEEALIELMSGVKADIVRRLESADKTDVERKLVSGVKAEV